MPHSRPSPLPSLPTALLGLAASLAGVCAIGACGSEQVSGSNSAATPQAGQELGLVIHAPGNERPYFHDFGEVRFGEVVTHTFELHNTDSVPVTIEDLQPTCSCTVPLISYTDEAGQIVRGRRLGEPVITLPPGAVAQLRLEVDSRHIRYKNTDKLTMVVVRCDSKNTPFLRLEAHLLVTQAYQATPELIDLGDVPVSSGARGKSDVITGLPGAGYRILGVLEESEGLEARVVEQPIAEGTLWQVQVNLVPPLEEGLWQGKVLLNSTGPDGDGEDEPLEIGVRGRVVPDVIPYPPVFGFLSPAQGAGPRAEGSLRALAPGHRIKIVDAELVGTVPDGLRIYYEPDSPDADGRSGRWQLVLEAPADLESELFTGILRVMLEDPAQDPIEIEFVYRRP